METIMKEDGKNIEKSTKAVEESQPSSSHRAKKMIKLNNSITNNILLG